MFDWVSGLTVFACYSVGEKDISLSGNSLMSSINLRLDISTMMPGTELDKPSANREAYLAIVCSSGFREGKSTMV